MGWILTALLVASGIHLIVEFWLINTRARDAEVAWQEFQDVNDERARAINALVKHMGYGGMIHNYKDYILHRDDSSILRFQDAVGAAKEALSQYDQVKISDAEKRAIWKIREAIDAYAKSIVIARVMVSEGSSASQIDEFVRINNEPALKGVATLIAGVAANRQSEEMGQTKTQILADLRIALGFGGMVHNFKNYILRKKPPYSAKVAKNLQQASTTIARYRRKELNDKEEVSLAAIEGVIAAYKANLKKARTFASKKRVLPEEIDRLVVVDDGPALRGMVHLTREVLPLNHMKRRQVTESLDTIRWLAQMMLIIVVVGGAVLLVPFVWIMWYLPYIRARSIDDYLNAIDFYLSKVGQYLQKPETDDLSEKAIKKLQSMTDLSTELVTCFKDHKDRRDSVLDKADLSPPGKPDKA